MSVSQHCIQRTEILLRSLRSTYVYKRRAPSNIDAIDEPRLLTTLIAVATDLNDDDKDEGEKKQQTHEDDPRRASFVPLGKARPCATPLPDEIMTHFRGTTVQIPIAHVREDDLRQQIDQGHGYRREILDGKILQTAQLTRAIIQFLLGAFLGTRAAMREQIDRL